MPKTNSETSNKSLVNHFVNSHFSDRNYNMAFTEDGFNRLRSYMSKVEAGQPKVFTAPFAKGVAIETVLKEWNATLESIQGEWPSLYEFESDMKAKVGPLSVQLPLSERLIDVAHYYLDVRTSGEPIDPRAITWVMNEYSSMRGLRLRSTEKTVDSMKKSTNSGSPFFTKRRLVTQETIPCTTITYEGRHPDAYSLLKLENRYEVPAVIGWRGQEGGPSEEDVKQRVVWMFPYSVNINELQVYQPFIEAAQKLNIVPAWVSMEQVDKRITELMRTKGSDDLVVCTDFSRFDQHFNVHLQECAETILSHILHGGEAERSWLRDVFPAKYFIPLLWQADKSKYSVFEGFHGMASGSGGTNVDETLTHRALQYEAAIAHGEFLNPNSQCLGDDGILSYPGITVEDVVNAYQSHGLECNPDKQYASTQDCIYLRRWHHQNYVEEGVCVGVYSTMRAIGRLRYLERFMDPEVWSKEMVALRQLSIIENCKYHPLKTQFAQFCMARDKYRLGLDIPGFLDDLPKYAKDAVDYMPDFLGYTKTLQGWKSSGINEWWIVKYLKSVR